MAPLISCMASLVAIKWRQIFRFHFGMHRFNYHNGIIHHNTNGQYQCKQGNQVERNAKELHEHKRADQRHRHGNGWNKRRTPVAQEKEHHQAHQYKGFHQRMNHFFNRGIQKFGTS